MSLSRLNEILKFRPKEILSPVSKRFLLIPHLLMSLFVGLALWFDDTVRQASAIVQIFDWLNPSVMAIGFTMAFVCGIYSLLTASWRAYVITNLLVFCLSMSWLLSLLVAKYFLGTLATASIANFGIWAFITSDCIVIASINNRVISTKAKV